MTSLFVVLCLVLCFSSSGWAQENAGSSVADSLRECYNNELFTKDRRLPTTINILVDLIRKVEDGPTALDARELSVQLIQRFKQDGILRSERASSPFSLPYSPRGQQSFKNRILLQSLVPGNALTFPNNTLTALERCSLHFMLSNSIDLTRRNDESTVCSRLSRYTTRYRRSYSDEVDVEIFDPKGEAKLGNLEEPPQEDIPAVDDPGEEGGIEDPNVEIFSRSGADLSVVSECPVENGVVYTQWGAIQAGTVISGIAAGFEKQSITTINSSFVVDSRYAATLTGDLSEAALIQGAIGSTINIGAPGGWNSTTVPRWYFIQQKEDWEMTDAEIRAGLDGLTLALNIESWRSSIPSLKVSQLLDMYYSPRGVFNSSIRACNRKNLQTTIAPFDVLNAQTAAFNAILDDVATLEGTLPSDQLLTLAEKAVTNFLNYLPNNLDDLSCISTPDSVVRAATDIIIVLDTTWPYAVIQPALAYFLDNIDVNKYGTNYTIVSGRDFSVIVNSTRSLVDFHVQYNLTVHQSFAPGFDYVRVYNDAQELIQGRIDNDTTVGGKSSLVLLLPYTTTINEDERTFVVQRRDVFRGYVPDVRLLVLGFGSKDNYADAVFDSTYDIFTLTGSADSNTIINAIKPVVSRVKEIPRRIVNPECKSDWGGSTSSNSLEQYVEPGSINYYRVAPNYFYRDTGDRAIRVRGSGYGPLVVCTSGSVVLPMQNDTSEAVTCTTVNADEASFSLNDQCNGHSYISSCPPFYFSVAPASNVTTTGNFRCTDSGCRFPDNLKYTVSTVNFGCAGSAIRNIASIGLLFITILFAQL